MKPELKRRLFCFVAVTLAIFISYGYGVFTGAYHVFPYYHIRSLKRFVANRDAYVHQASHALSDAYEWIEVSKKAEFAPRDGAGALVFGDRMWLIGGWNPNDVDNFPLVCNNEVWSSPDGLSWQLEKANTFLDGSFDVHSDWEGRHTAGYVVYKGKMWIVGGDANQGHYQSDVWNSEDGRAWKWVNEGHPVPWGPRVLHYTVVFQDRIWVIGGQTLPQFAPANETYYSDIWATSDGIEWEHIIPKQPSWLARGMIGGCVVYDGRIWILGGGTYDIIKNKNRDKNRGEYYNDVWSSADGLNWTLHTKSAQWHPRSYHDVAVFDGFMWVWRVRIRATEMMFGSRMMESIGLRCRIRRGSPGTHQVYLFTMVPYGL